MSVRQWIDCPTCGGEITQKPVFPEGKECCVWVGKCAHCGHTVATPGQGADSDDVAECIAKYKAEERELLIATIEFSKRIIPRGVPANGDTTHKCETCVHYAMKGGFGLSGSGEAIYCTEYKQFLIDNRCRLLRNQSNDCEQWCPVINEGVSV